jgi:hypothetical protein
MVANDSLQFEAVSQSASPSPHQFLLVDGRELFDRSFQPAAVVQRRQDGPGAVAGGNSPRLSTCA